MATQANVPSSVQLPKLAVLPFAAPQAITQLELSALLCPNGRVHQLEEQVDAAEQSISVRLGDHELPTSERRMFSFTLQPGRTARGSR
jgi:hypothetical protein